MQHLVFRYKNINLFVIEDHFGLAKLPPTLASTELTKYIQR